MSLFVLNVLKAPVKCGFTNKSSLKRLVVVTNRDHTSFSYRFVRKYSRRMTDKPADSTFKGLNDRYNGIIVSSDKEKCSNDDFPIKLQESLQAWIEHNRRGIWFKVFLEEAEWVPHLVKNGFKYHHSKENYVMLYKWLPETEVCNIPPYAHTSIGVGSVVVNDTNQILVVSEKYRIADHWKLPGGYVEPGENVIDAAIREVMEETGVKAEFMTLLSFRHAHGGIFDCSDMYIVVALKALTSEFTKCSRELDDCAWMDINEYIKHPRVHELNRLFVEKYLEYKENNVRIRCDHGIHSMLKKEYMVYHVVKD